MSELFDHTIKTKNAEYLALRDNPNYSNVKYYCETMWEKFEPFADSSFRNEFSNDMHSRFWEMYLASQLLDQGFELISRKIIIGPDIHIFNNHRNIWIEATAPTGGIGDDAINSVLGHSAIGVLPENQIILRISNAISEKHKKWKKYIKDNIISFEDPYIIAINGGRIRILLLETIPYILKATYAIGDVITEFDTQTGKIINSHFEYCKEITKKNRATVVRGLFFDPTYSGISGILYSNAALWNLPESPGNEIIYLHNTLASICMQECWLKIGKDYKLEGNQFRIRICDE